MLNELLKKIKEYNGIGWNYVCDDSGYLAWQRGTGDNIEIMFIKVKEPGKGHATRLLREMMRRTKPFNSVYVFRLASNETAGYFYRAKGFKETLIKDLYTEDAVLGVVNYKELCQNLSIN